MRIRKVHDPQRNAIDFADVHPRVAHRAIVAIAHHLAMHPAEAEWPNVDDVAGYLNSIDRRTARLKYRLVGAEAPQLRGREPLGVDFCVDGGDEHSSAANGIGGSGSSTVPSRTSARWTSWPVRRTHTPQADA